MRTTVGDASLIPPIVYTMIRQIYVVGALPMKSIVCRRVGFNKHLYEELQIIGKALTGPPLVVEDFVRSPAQEDTGKRKLADAAKKASKPNKKKQKTVA